MPSLQVLGSLQASPARSALFLCRAGRAAWVFLNVGGSFVLSLPSSSFVGPQKGVHGVH